MQDQLIVSSESKKRDTASSRGCNEYGYNFNNDGILSLRAFSFSVIFMLSHLDSLVTSLINEEREQEIALSQVAGHIFVVSEPSLGNPVDGCMMNEQPLIGPIVQL